MARNSKAHPNEVADVRLSQDALRRLYQFHSAYVAGRQGGRRAMLRRCDLSALDFNHMNFSEAIFVDCDFTAIEARGAKFSGAILRSAKFDKADLTAADFAFLGVDLKPVVEIGKFKLWVAPSAEAEGLAGEFEVS